MVVYAETGTSTSARQVSRQFSQSAPHKQVMIRNGSRTTLLMTVLNPCAIESMSLVNRDMSSGRPLVGEAGKVQRHGSAEEQVADVEQAQLRDVGDENFLEELEQTLDGHAGHHERNQK